MGRSAARIAHGGITIRKARLGEDERLDREFWAELTPDERIHEMIGAPIISQTAGVEEPMVSNPLPAETALSRI